MNTKIMEGLVGAGTNMRQTDTTMRVYRDARRRGDLDVMERAMEYTGDYTQKAGEYQEKAQEGMEEEAVENREKIKAQMAEAIENRRNEKKAQEEAAKEASSEQKPIADTVEVSPEGLALAQEAMNAKEGQEGTEKVFAGAKVSSEPVADTGTGAVKPATYTSAGAVKPAASQSFTVLA